MFNYQTNKMAKLTMYNSEESGHLFTITSVIKLFPNTTKTSVHLLNRFDAKGVHHSRENEHDTLDDHNNMPPVTFKTPENIVLNSIYPYYNSDCILLNSQKL
jgi:hypothetical protein